MSPGKAQFPPLLPPGFHLRSLLQLRELTVQRFNHGAGRESLFAALESAIERIEAAKIPCELWIDGSFLTEKMDPDDIDIALFLPAHLVVTGGSGIAAVLKWAASPEALAEGLDIHRVAVHPDNSPMSALSRAERAYFELLFGTEYDGVTPKGVAVVRICGGVQ